ncbi:hypothetical protein ACFQ1I_46445 [Kitasatospora arboriphila]
MVTTSQIDPARPRPHPALPSSALADAVFKKLMEDLGRVQTGRTGQLRTYTPRVELLAEAVTPDTFLLVLQWISSTRRGSIQTKRNYVDDVRRVWAGYAAELGHERFFVGCFTAEQVTAWRIRAEAQGARPRRSPATCARCPRCTSTPPSAARTCATRCCATTCRGSTRATPAPARRCWRRRRSRRCTPPPPPSST